LTKGRRADADLLLVVVSPFEARVRHYFLVGTPVYS
jgi:hypothetical protein